MAASYEFHYTEFLSRGLSEAEADRLARAVVARDAEGGHGTKSPPLELSSEEAAAHLARDRARREAVAADVTKTRAAAAVARAAQVLAAAKAAESAITSSADKE